MKFFVPSHAQHSTEIPHRTYLSSNANENVSSFHNAIAVMEKVLSMTEAVVRQRNDIVSLQNIGTMHKTLEQLLNRIKQSMIPSAAFYKTLNEVRVEALLLVCHLYVQGMYDHQILISPKREWREHLRTEHEELPLWYNLDTDSVESVATRLQSQMDILSQAKSILLHFYDSECKG